MEHQNIIAIPGVFYCVFSVKLCNKISAKVLLIRRVGGSRANRNSVDNSHSFAWKNIVTKHWFHKYPFLYLLAIFSRISQLNIRS